MAKLIYSAIMSLDGYVADSKGEFNWSMPDEEVHRFINERQRPITHHLLGRRLYEVMSVWDTWDTSSEPPFIDDFAQLWRRSEKVVFSRTLQGPPIGNTRIEREYKADDIRKLKASAATEISIGGPELAAQAFRDGLVDECQLVMVPVLVGGGKRGLPEGVGARLELVQERAFGNGAIFLKYRVLS